MHFGGVEERGHVGAVFLVLTAVTRVAKETGVRSVCRCHQFLRVLQTLVVSPEVILIRFAPIASGDLYLVSEREGDWQHELCKHIACTSHVSAAIRWPAPLKALLRREHDETISE